MSESFEARLAARVALILGAAVSAGCGGEAARAESCQGADPPAGYRLRTGFLAVEPGAECPPASEVDAVEITCGPRFAGPVCTFVGRKENQVYVAEETWWTTWDTGVTGHPPESEVKDHCLYEAVFEDHRDGVCGRPLLATHGAVVAPVRRSTDWGDGAAPDLSGISGDEVRAAGAHWLACALLEHASVASFARFTLQLLQLGAPAELVAESQRAGSDEVAHARLCFALAEACLGFAVGPGPLDLGGVAFELEPTAIAVADETRHAAFAWRALRWLLDQPAPGLERACLEAAFEMACARIPSGRPVPEGGASGRLGLVDPRRLERAYRDAVRDVLRPAWAELRASEAGRSRRGHGPVCPIGEP